MFLRPDPMPSAGEWGPCVDFGNELIAVIHGAGQELADKTKSETPIKSIRASDAPDTGFRD